MRIKKKLRGDGRGVVFIDTCSRDDGRVFLEIVKETIGSRKLNVVRTWIFD